MTHSLLQHYTARAVGGWMVIVQASNQREGARTARGFAATASLLPSDVESVTPSTSEEMEWYRSMGGLVPENDGKAA